MARAVDIVRGHRDAPLVVVVSALAGVTDALLEIATRAVQGDAEFVRAGAAAVRTRHVAAAEALLAPGPRRDELLPPIAEAFAELRQILAAPPYGRVATLAGGGSDLTATLLGRALGARDVALWKDVPGLLTADPRVVPDARVVPQLHVREAAELAYYGAKVLYPRALIPLGQRNVAIRIRSFADPSSPGTEISRRRTLDAYPVKALSAATGQALLTVEGNGMLGVPGIAARTFAAVHRKGISVSLITQASSEHSICFGVPEAAAEGARASLIAEFQSEIARRGIAGGEGAPGRAPRVVAGLGMAAPPW